MHLLLKQVRLHLPSLFFWHFESYRLFFFLFVTPSVSQGLKVEEVDQSGVQRIFWGAEEGGTNDLTVKILLFTSI